MQEPLEALVLAGGKGTRLRPLTYDIPKPMVPVAGRPFLEYLLDELVRQDVAHCVLSVGYLGQQIRDHVGAEYRGMPVSYVTEDRPMGTGGGIALCLPKLRSTHFLVLNGDTFFQIDLASFLASHLRHQAQVSIGLKQMRDFDRYGSVVSEENGRISAFEEKRAMDEGYINAGVYAIERGLFTQFDFNDTAFSFENDLLRDHIREIRAYGYRSEGYFIDIGIPEDYQRAQTELPALVVDT